MSGVARTLSFGLLLICSCVSGKTLVGPEFDHLTPVNLKEYANYRKLLISKLGQTPFNCGRAIIMPPFESEGSTSVYSIFRNGRKTYFVTCIDAERNLWQRTDAVHYPERAKSVRLQRRDAEIPEHTAQLVRDVFLRMLKNARPIKEPANLIVLDSTNAEFSLERPNAAPLCAELNFSFSYPGRKTKPFIDMWNSLYDYCKAAPEKRGAISDQIERNAILLLRILTTRR